MYGDLVRLMLQIQPGQVFFSGHLEETEQHWTVLDFLYNQVYYFAWRSHFPILDMHISSGTSINTHSKATGVYVQWRARQHEPIMTIFVN